MREESNKTDRLLFFYDKLMMGDTLYKEEAAKQFDVHERTIRRDIQDIKYYLARFYIKKDIIYDPILKGYALIGSETVQLQLGEIVALSKIILDSKTLTKEESRKLFTKIGYHFLESRHDVFKKSMKHDLFSYIPREDAFEIFNMLGKVIEAIYHKRTLTLSSKVHKLDKRVIYPVGLVYKQSHFYIAAFSRDTIHCCNSCAPEPYILDKNTIIDAHTIHFSLPLTFYFDEEAFKKSL